MKLLSEDPEDWKFEGKITYNRGVNYVLEMLRVELLHELSIQALVYL